MFSARTPAQLRQELSRMEARADRAESDGEYETCRQVIIALRAELESAERNALKLGDRVAYSAKFLRSTAQFSGVKPFKRGHIVAFEMLGHFQQARVAWDDGTESVVHVNNLVAERNLAWESVQ